MRIEDVRVHIAIDEAFEDNQWAEMLNAHEFESAVLQVLKELEIKIVTKEK